MDESKVQELRAIHDDLAHYLVAQNEILVSVTRAVAAIQHALDNDSAPQGGHSALSNKYRERLAALIASESLRPNPSVLALGSLVKKLNEW